MTRVGTLAAALLLLPAAGARAQEQAQPLPAVVKEISCVRACGADGAAVAESVVRVRGRRLTEVRFVVFLAGPGPRDDVLGTTLRTRRRSVDVRVPPGAGSGRVRLRSATGAAYTSVAAVTVGVGPPAPGPRSDGGGAEAGQAPPPSDHVFPVRGPHTFGGAGARFGASRAGHTHQGQDVAAACGTPLVAAQGGSVVFKAWQDKAGNYVVIRGAGDGFDHVYMHLAVPAVVERGAQVATGQRIGEVGDTGDAVGCHLHFELWSNPGWYEGGAPFDPLPSLKEWDAAS